MPDDVLSAILAELRGMRQDLTKLQRSDRLAAWELRAALLDSFGPVYAFTAREVYWEFVDSPALAAAVAALGVDVGADEATVAMRIAAVLRRVPGVEVAGQRDHAALYIVRDFDSESPV